MLIKVRFKMNVAWYMIGQVIECERDAQTEALIRLGVIEEVKEPEPERWLSTVDREAS